MVTMSAVLPLVTECLTGGGPPLPRQKSRSANAATTAALASATSSGCQGVRPGVSRGWGPRFLPWSEGPWAPRLTQAEAILPKHSGGVEDGAQEDPMRSGYIRGQLLSTLESRHQGRRHTVLQRALFGQGVTLDVMGQDPAITRLVLIEVGRDPANLHAEAGHPPQRDPKVLVCLWQVAGP